MIIAISGKLNSGKDSVAKIIQGLDAGLKESVILDCLNSPDGDSWLTESKWETRRFADKLKDTVCMWIGCTREQLEDRKFKEAPLGEEWACWEYKTSNSAPLRFTMDKETARMEGSWNWGKREMTPRLMMQLLGTDCGRKIIHPNIWVNALFADYKATKDVIGESCINAEDVDIYYPDWIIPDMRFPNEAQAVKDRGGILIRINRPSESTRILSDAEQHPSELALDHYQNWDYVINNDETLEDLLEKVKSILKKEELI